MNKTNEQLETLTEIRDLMKRSSRFLSLSGLSGVFAGVFALCGAAAAWFYLRSGFFDNRIMGYSDRGIPEAEFYFFFAADAGSVLILSLLAGWFFSQRKARREGIPFWGAHAWRAFANLMIPLATGGLFCLALLLHNVIGFIPAATLIFYGLALVNASKYTFNDIRFLGICEIALGLAGMIFPGYGLLFWTVGFGVLHIVYGIVIYYKYERR